MRVIREFAIPPEQVIEVTHLNSKEPEFIVGVIEQTLDISYYGPGREPEVITFNGRRFVPEV